MRLRTIALAVALASGLAATLGAREKPASQFRKTKPGKTKAPKYKNPKYKQHKNKRRT